MGGDNLSGLVKRQPDVIPWIHSREGAAVESVGPGSRTWAGAVGPGTARTVPISSSHPVRDPLRTPFALGSLDTTGDFEWSTPTF
jgi:hypothetical protein